MLPPPRKRKMNPMLMKVILISVVLHVGAAFVAGVIKVATIVIQEDTQFEEPPVIVEKEPPPPVKVKIKPPPPKQQPRALSMRPIANIAIDNVDVDLPDMDDSFTVSAGLGGIGGGNLLGGSGGMGLGLKMPEINFFGAKSSGEKIAFVVHFGPATTSGAGTSNAYTRMTAYTIRKRLEEMVQELPDQALFNVAAFWANHCTPFAAQMLPANGTNKQQLLNWMAPVNPVEGSNKTYGSSHPKEFNKRLSGLRWPQRLDKGVPAFGPAWYYDYRTPKDINNKYLPKYKKGTYHWGRGLIWALTTQKPDTIFILTTNYLPNDKDHPKDIVAAYEQICKDIYDPADLKHPTVNVVVLAPAGSNPVAARRVLDERFRPIIRASGGKGSVIEDIRKYMNSDEKRRLAGYTPPKKKGR
ncbi:MULTISPECIES: hypothetical protein [unclassified Lentimonas]|uniref:hypothetical protein n=2 Tax=unclassified Lentimonas TaxID=2630993 RepID=UPI001389A771|nr:MULTISPECIES: hypothetical protein [unclassified Lentimonas]